MKPKKRSAVKTVSAFLAVASLTVASAPALAFDVSFSGFGTLGFAESNRPYTYWRFIDDHGTFKRDSVLGLQADAKLVDGVGATVQLKGAPATASDRRYQATVSWAFVSYRPANDWLFRAGKQRIPFYLYSETVDVGTTYEFARLPTEMYSLAPSNDFTGLSAGKNWTIGGGELSLDGYWGESRNDFRFWFRDGIPPAQGPGSVFTGFNFKGGGLALTFRRQEDMARIALLRAHLRTRSGQPLPVDFPFVPVGPGVGYYQVDPALPGPGVPTADSITNTTLTVGLDAGLPLGLRFIGEYARSTVPQSRLAPKGTRGYVALLRNFGPWTPYASYAFLHSPSATLDFYRQVNSNRLPAAFPGAAQINASQRAGADQIIAFDQSSWALGASYAFSATSKLKTEFSRTRIGQVSQLVDAPPGGDVQHQHIDVLSVSYSFVF